MKSNIERARRRAVLRLHRAFRLVPHEYPDVQAESRLIVWQLTKDNTITEETDLTLSTVIIFRKLIDARAQWRPRMKRVRRAGRAGWEYETIVPSSEDQPDRSRGCDADEPTEDEIRGVLRKHLTHHHAECLVAAARGETATATGARLGLTAARVSNLTFQARRYAKQHEADIRERLGI